MNEADPAGARGTKGAGRRRRQRRFDRLWMREGVSHRSGADLAITWLNEKARPHVEPLARELERRSSAQLDVADPGTAGSDVRPDRGKVGPARHSRPFDRLRAQGGPAGRPAQLLGRRLRQGDGRFLPFLRPDGEARGAADDRRRDDVRDELLRRQSRRAELQCHGPGEGGAGSGVPLSRLRTRPARHPRACDLAGPAEDPGGVGPEGLRAAVERGGEKAPLGELVDIMDVGYACAYLATPFAQRITGGTVYVDGGANIVA